MKRVAVEDITAWARDPKTTKAEICTISDMLKRRLQDMKVEEDTAEVSLALAVFEKDPSERSYRAKFDMWWSYEVKRECTNQREGACIADICAHERPRHASIFYLNTDIALCHSCVEHLKAGVETRALEDFEKELFD